MEDTSNGLAFHDDKFVSKNGNPKELFLSSDANALVEHTKKVLVIEDGEVVHLKVLVFILFSLFLCMCKLTSFSTCLFGLDMCFTPIQILDTNPILKGFCLAFKTLVA
jgi:hypothetical protein